MIFQLVMVIHLIQPIIMCHFICHHFFFISSTSARGGLFFEIKIIIYHLLRVSVCLTHLKKNHEILGGICDSHYH